MKRSSYSVAPSAARLMNSLRDIGYDFSGAIADLIDNSITAGASEIDVAIEFEGENSRVIIADNGMGMTPNVLTEALRFGTRRDYEDGDLGRYGLGLKTASLSQGRCLTVITRRSRGARVVHVRQLDLDLVEEFDDWLIIDPGQTASVVRAKQLLQESPGTVIIWEKLDRILPEKNPSGGWARRRFENLVAKVEERLSMVFHRFLRRDDPNRITISVNGTKLVGWDPFARDQELTEELPFQRFEIEHKGHSGFVALRRFVLPGRDRFSSAAEFEKMSGPLKWNRQQGLYVYRAGRLVQWGGWAGLRAIDEHTKLARVSLEFDTDLDEAFNINVSKMRVSIPAQLRPMLERPINEVCSKADDAYRKSGKRKGSQEDGGDVTESRTVSAPELGLALKSIAAQIGEYDALQKIIKELEGQMPEVASALGF